MLAWQSISKRLPAGYKRTIWAKEHKLEHRSRRSHPHDGLWMPFHDAVLEVEPLKITNRRRLDHLGKTETMPTDLGDLGAVEAEEEELVVD